MPIEASQKRVDWVGVRAVCRMLGISLSQLARDTGYARTYIHKMMSTGRNGPETSAKLAKSLGVPESCLLLEDDSGEGEPMDW